MDLEQGIIGRIIGRAKNFAGATCRNQQGADREQPERSFRFTSHGSLMAVDRQSVPGSISGGGEVLVVLQ
jgi:hypothetical protein